MKCVRLIISKDGYEALRAFADDNYLYEYIGVRIDIWTHFMRECIINYVH